MYKRFKKLFDKEEGYILVTSFVVLLVIVILGVVYANLAITQSRQAEQHNDRKQAYYYARSGSERAYKEMAEGLDKSIYDKFKDFSWNIDEEFDPDNPNDNSKNIEVNITLYPEKINSNDDIRYLNKIIVESTGREGDIIVDKGANLTLTYKPELTLDESTDDITIPNGEDKIDSGSIELVAGNSGIMKPKDENYYDDSDLIMVDDESYQDEKWIVIEANANDLKLKDKIIYLGAMGFKITSKNLNVPVLSLSITDSYLILTAEKVIFEVPVTLNGYSSLCFYHPNGGSVYFSGGVKHEEFGEILSPGVYTYPPNKKVCIPGSNSDIEDWNKIWN